MSGVEGMGSTSRILASRSAAQVSTDAALSRKPFALQLRGWY